MSLNIASSIALGSLMTTQVQISVTSSNISNASTTGYTVKTANQSATVTGGVGTGTTITGITSTVDKLLLKSLVQATSALGSATTTNSYLDQLQALYGTSGDSSNTSLADTLTTLEQALSSLSSDPSSSSLKANVISALDTLATRLRDTSSGIQDLRSDADQSIDAAVDVVNEQLNLIAGLNAQIRLAAASGQATGDLEDQRNTAVQEIASRMNVSYFISSSGDMQIYTGSGRALLDSTVHELSYTPAATVTSSTTYSASSAGGFSGITVDGVDVTGQISSGSIGALIVLRDTTLPAAQAQLDQLATELADSLNAVSNLGSALPPKSTLTGTTAVTASDALNGTGTVRIAVTDQKGALVSYGDLDLANYATVGDLVNAVNGISGLSASIDSSGHVVIVASSSSNGIAIANMTGSVGDDSLGLSDYLGLNDVVTATSAADFKVAAGLLADSSKLPTSSLSSASSLTAGSTVLSAGSSTVTDALYSALTGTTSFAAVGGLGASDSSFADYAAEIIAHVATIASAAEDAYTAKQTAQSTLSSALSSQSGVNVDEETAKLSNLQNQYAAAAQLIQAINEMFDALLSAVQSAG
ncbi:flagellar hook-associated protein FlgK [Rhodopseudomonas palustris]|uniref:flagellar hook-associated protein FlgK n=1 Tax=Rhodopseudomonas palustris TaxID=1076 RepID=UPI00115D699B|nr:flagellar hook-associated protein FlgK [Rhodopseudomonas palustris]QDL99145.1 flagellar hook-associated protein FlgK [Rhodopseudomonas palustris]